MGSLMLAAAGAVGGLGAGITEVGQQAQKEQLLEKQSDLAAARDATHERLRADYEARNQQAEQERTIAAAKEAHGVEHGEAVTAAGAQREQQTALEKSKEVAAQQRTETTGQYRVKARLAGAGQPKQTPEWTLGHYQQQGALVKDPTDPNGKRMVMQPGGTIQTMYNNRLHQTFVQAGSKYIPYDATKMGSSLPTSASVHNAPAEAISALLQDPYGVNPGTGRTKADEFAEKFGHLPGQYFDAIKNPPGGPNAKPSGGPLGPAAPPGSKYVPGQSYTNTGEAYTDNAAEDAAADREDDAAAAQQNADDNAPAQ